MNTQIITETIEVLTKNGFTPMVVDTKEQALERIKELIPQGASVMNGSSVTLDQIGYIDLLKSNSHGWNNLHAQIIAEKDQVKQNMLRKTSTIADFYLGSVHALSQTGEMVIASNTGSQFPNIVFNSANVVFVVGENKLTDSLSSALKRIEEQVIPLEDERMKKVYGIGTTYAKTLILHKENPMMGRKVYVIIVKESLGF